MGLKEEKVVCGGVLVGYGGDRSVVVESVTHSLITSFFEMMKSVVVVGGRL